ncbi:DNA-directed RNA polymerase subunit beta [Candidatus Azambacteria bacterium RBG_16_47_10]|uniref:DNA-directed RNA polymerase subunit beta n=1 Tax=Candidatus Azambacteria bacterium RBG_16_47_10 TaxID=1797292 RepID=A0A1F5B1D6_9BACT|nr:MAG: DNA-directed RNA polymerase subunit beta [Candidatus Azambacteria bacterium RBG_16_47_10]
MNATKKTKLFSSLEAPAIALPNLVEAQLNSYQWFIEKGLRELFDEVSPIKDYSGKDLALSFLDYYFDEPKNSERKAKEHGLSYEAPLRVKVRLENKKGGEIKDQEIYLGDFPIMTKRGTFIVNGVERVIVSQIIRSSGVFFTAEMIKGKKAFGAKIIPSRGAWIEFETDADGAINVRIDRKRKMPVSTLFRIFGFKDNDEIMKAFADIDPDGTHMDATLKKDLSETAEDSYLEIYKRIRPGDPVTAESAKQLIDGMFFSLTKYDLSDVGRYKLSIRLYGEPSEKMRTRDIKAEERLLNKKDLTLIVREIIRLNTTPHAMPDDVDHLGNRRVKSVGELLQGKLRVGFTRIERIVKDRMSTLDVFTLTPSQLVNVRPLMAAVKEFFTSYQLSQFMDQINPLAELEHKRRLSALGPGGLTRERAGFEVRDVHPSHYGRICPIETPEGPNIGLVGHLASHARVNKYGFIETPYRRVKNAKITDEIVHLDASEGDRYVIAAADVGLDKNGKIIEETVGARIKGTPGLISAEEIDFIDVAPNQFISVAASFIPFLEHDDANRALMGSNMQRQAVPCIRQEAPLVSTGAEDKAAHDSGQVVVAEEDGEVVSVDADHVTIKPAKGKEEDKKYEFHSFVRSNQYSSLSQQPTVVKGMKVKRGDVLADGSATDNGVMALGQNLVVAFLSFSGSNYEDAIIISERLVEDDRFTSIHIEDFSVDVRDTKLGPEITTYDIPNVGEDRLKDLDEEGVVRIGAEADSNDILVGKISPKGEADLTPEERLLRAIFGEHAREVKDTSLRLPHGKRGRVVGVKTFSRDRGDKLPSGVIKSIRVEIAQLRKIAVGDKLAGRHGNKGVISKILPVEDMPYLEDGSPVDIILNPLGVASRMNIGQILETHLGWAALKLGYRAITPSMAGASEDDIKNELEAAGIPRDGKVWLYDGRTGEKFDQPVTVGVMYILKLNHLVEDKIHMRSIGPYSLITQQPLGGKAQFGGQRLGEMEVWALEGYGAAYTLQEMLTIKSDDVVGRTAAYDSIIRGEKIKNPNIPASFHVLVNELKSLGLAVTFGGEQREASEDDENA